MCDFNTLKEQDKELYHNQLLGYAQSIGGINFFLQLIEAIRETKPNPLVSTHREFSAGVATIKWNKSIYQDKLQLLQRIRAEDSKSSNLLPAKETKNYKKVLNLLRTLKPIVFTVRPAHREDGDGFIFQPFEIIDDEHTKMSIAFEMIFFCSIENVKKILNYTPKS